MKSFVYAFSGIASAVRGERNMRIHLLAAVAAVSLGALLGLSACEWAAVVICCALVMSLECLNAELLQKVFLSVPNLLGRKLIYTHIDPGVKSNELSKAFSRLAHARIVAKVCHTSANGIPIGAQADASTFKPLFLDVGLACHAVGLRLDDFIDKEGFMLANKGQICEQFIGQHLLYSGKEYEMPVAYCWMREARNSSAEVDYIIQLGTDIVPVEVKGGATGRLKSLNFFLNEKKRRFGVRFNIDNPSFLPDAEVADSLGRKCRYSLLSLPMYMVCQLKRLAREAMEMAK